MLLTYLINLTYVVLRKCSGQTIENDPSIDRLIEIRTVLEKIRPIDHKLRYQIDKLVKTAQNTTPNSGGILRANLGHAATPLPEESAQTQDSEGSEDGDGVDEEKNRKRPTKAGGSGLYVPPKLIPMHYEEDEGKADRNRKQIERAKKRSIGMAIIEDLKEEYLDTPVEIAGTSRAQQMLSRAQKEKEEYEETYLTRLPITKAEKHRQRKLTTLGTLGDELTRFGDMSAREGGSSKNKAGKRKRKGAPKKKSGKKAQICVEIFFVCSALHTGKVLTIRGLPGPDSFTVQHLRQSIG
uniref:Protein involved in rrna processing n=1 Tax=Lutzomyia longipalpis TaxID=7200 RepID=A0A7G3AUJ8_LUTLO